MSKLVGVDTHLGPEMNPPVSNGHRLPLRGSAGQDFTGGRTDAAREAGSCSVYRIEITGSGPDHQEIGRYRYKLYATEGTAAMLSAMGCL